MRYVYWNWKVKYIVEKTFSKRKVSTYWLMRLYTNTNFRISNSCVMSIHQHEWKRFSTKMITFNLLTHIHFNTIGIYFLMILKNIEAAILRFLDSSTINNDWKRYLGLTLLTTPSNERSCLARNHVTSFETVENGPLIVDI